MNKTSFFKWIAFVFLIFAGGVAATPGELPPPTSATEEIRETLLDAYQSDLAEEKALHPEFLEDLFYPEFDEVFLSEDGKTAMIWIALRDSSGTVLATEPGLILARLVNDGWRMVFPDDTEWADTLSAFPAQYIPAEYSPIPEGVLPKNSQIQTLTGYYLPYVAGTRHWLEGSVLHFNSFPARGYPSCTQEVCQYAYDFTDGGHFPLVASKDGTVVASRDSCTDGNSYCTNYMILKSSADGYYQLYLHMANSTIPDKLTVGTLVKRGQYLGDTDDTGYSTTEHVHFMVTNSWWWAGDGYPWGISQDIRFADVAINGGIPRTCYEVTKLPIYNGATECLGSKTDPLNPNNDWFASGNAGAFPPTGNLTRPTEGKVVATSNTLMDVTAAASDDVRVKQVVLLGYINGAWKEIPPRVTTPNANGLFDWDVNLCNEGPLNGQLQLRLKVWDHEGNVVALPAIRTVTVDHACLPPASAMTTSTTYDSSAAKLNWNVTPSPSGLSKFEVQWRGKGSVWSATQTINLGATARSAWFVGSLGGTYEFRLRAFDNNGQPEAWPAGDLPEQSITFPTNCTPDVGEVDNTYQTAKPIFINSTLTRNFCQSGDVDWYRLDTSEWLNYMVSTTPKGLTGATVNL
ncbi:MAG: M23 family metallopeptidase, partial [Anaerolineaceae bacterium]